MKVAILGTVGSHRHLAPFDDPEWDIWVCSPGNAYGAVKRATKWFELHGIEDLRGVENAAWCGQYFGWLKSQTFPVYMQEPNDLLPGAATFPIKSLLDRFGDFGRIAFTSSISMMIAYAIQLGADEIAIYGVDMAASEEQYGNQKSGCQIMMALAKQEGIRVSVPIESSLDIFPPLYGYAEASTMGRVLLIKEQMAVDAVAKLNAEIVRLTGERDFAAGSLEQIRFDRRTWVDGQYDSRLTSPIDEVRTNSVSGDGANSPRTLWVSSTGSGLLVPKPNGHAEPQPEA